MNVSIKKSSMWKYRVDLCQLYKIQINKQIKKNYKLAG